MSNADTPIKRRSSRSKIPRSTKKQAPTSHQSGILKQGNDVSTNEREREVSTLKQKSSQKRRKSIKPPQVPKKIANKSATRKTQRSLVLVDKKLGCTPDPRQQLRTSKRVTRSGGSAENSWANRTRSCGRSVIEDKTVEVEKETQENVENPLTSQSRSKVSVVAEVARSHDFTEDPTDDRHGIEAGGKDAEVADGAAGIGDEEAMGAAEDIECSSREEPNAQADSLDDERNMKGPPRDSSITFKDQTKATSNMNTTQKASTCEQAVSVATLESASKRMSARSTPAEVQKSRRELVNESLLGQHRSTSLTNAEIAGSDDLPILQKSPQRSSRCESNREAARSDGSACASRGKTSNDPKTSVTIFPVMNVTADDLKATSSTRSGVRPTTKAKCPFRKMTKEELRLYFEYVKSVPNGKKYTISVIFPMLVDYLLLN